jgi:hypothetical protein
LHDSIPIRSAENHGESPRAKSAGRSANGGLLEARVGIEPTHKGFADLSLTTWVPRLVRWATSKTLARGRGSKFWSGRRGSNPRLRPWQGRTLPLSYSRSFSHSTALAHLLTIHCTRTGTRSRSRCSSTSATVPPLGRKRSMNWAWAFLALWLLCT